MASAHQPAGRSDAELLHLALAGEEPAFVLLYERLKGAIFRYAFYMTNSKSAAEEVTQEVFISLLKEGRKYRADLGDVAAFAFGMARNFVRRIDRRERPYQPLPSDEALENLSGDLICKSESLPGQMIRGELVEKMRSAIASLPEHYRQAVVLCDLCELSYADAASRLQCAVGTIRSRLNRAHTLLAQKLQPLRRAEPEIRATGSEGCII
jgi:RNA polymerase sigma-70 factor (ECF subfamily)